MPNKIFLKPKEQYVRHLDPVGAYIEQVGHYLATMTGKPLDQCKAFLRNGIKNKHFPTIQNPEITYYERAPNGDRAKTSNTLTSYIYDTVKNNEIIVPSFTVYLHPSVKPSLITKYVDGNTKRRSAAKKMMFIAKAQKDEVRYIYKNNEQRNMKLGNNSLSGAFAAKGSFVNNPSAHSSLTSTTRTGTSLANASNERLVAGNRHYYSPDVVLANLIAITENSDYLLIQKVMDQYQLAYPTINETMQCILYSTNLYWRDNRAMTKIVTFVSQLSPIQRVAFVYTGDLYHLRCLNPMMVRAFVTSLSSKALAPAEDALSVVDSLDENALILAHHICSDEVRGLGKDYKLMSTRTRASDGANVLGILVATTKQVIRAVHFYQSFINAFFTTTNLPPSVAHIRDMIRRCVVLSDTDSTCYSTGEWVEWMRGEIVFDAESLAISAAISYFATQTFTHTMAVYSANLNVEKAKLHTLAYKSEWTWPIMVPMNVAKHYFARALVQEGNVFEHPELELKGVHLKNSNTPPRITNDAKAMINKIMDTLTDNKKISIVAYLTEVAAMERLIIDSLFKGELEFYRQVKIKEPEAYAKDKEESPYKHHLLWNEVFAPKYGPLEDPPYAVAKIPTTLANPTKIIEWLASIEDREFAERMGAYILRNEKVAFNTFYISTNYLKTFGMIPELAIVIDIKRVILDLCNLYYLLLESLGYYKKANLMISELGY